MTVGQAPEGGTGFTTLCRPRGLVVYNEPGSHGQVLVCADSFTHTADHSLARGPLKIRGRDDEDILRRFQAGERAACLEIESWAKQVIRIRHFYVPPSDQEDLVQETMAQAWRAVSKPGFQLRESLRALVRKVAAARCIDRLRQVRPSLELDLALRDPGVNPHERVERRNERLLLRWVLRTLGPTCREIISLHFFEGLTYAAIGERLGRAEATMRVRMFNCMKEIRELLARCQDPFIGRPPAPESSLPRPPTATMRESDARAER